MERKGYAVTVTETMIKRGRKRRVHTYMFLYVYILYMYGYMCGYIASTLRERASYKIYNDIKQKNVRAQANRFEEQPRHIYLARRAVVGFSIAAWLLHWLP